MTVHRHHILVDDQWHTLNLTGPVLHVDARYDNAVDVWVLHTEGPTTVHRFRVFGTGHPLPDNVKHVGSALTGPGGMLVWHLFEDLA
jgi:hypothetical protein